MLAVFSKDLRSYFYSFTGYIFIGIFLLLSGLFFALDNVMGLSANYTQTLSSILFIFVLVIPVLTMRLMTDEVAQKTDRLLLTTPLSLTGIVVGKYLAAVTVFLITILVISLYPVILSFFGTIAVWETVGGILGFFFLGCTFISVGLFISTLTDNQVNAAVGTFGFILLMMLLDWLKQSVPTGRSAGIIFAAAVIVAIAGLLYVMMRSLIVSIATGLVGLIAGGLTYLFYPAFYEGLLTRFLAWFSLFERYGDFSMGILSTSSVIYYISFSAVFLFLTVRTLEKKRWS